MGMISDITIVKVRTGYAMERQSLECTLKVLGARHLRTMAHRYDAMRKWKCRGRYGDAEPLARQVTDARREMLRQRQPKTLTWVYGLYHLWLNQGQYPEAEHMGKQVFQWRSGGVKY